MPSKWLEITLEQNSRVGGYNRRAGPGLQRRVFLIFNRSSAGQYLDDIQHYAASLVGDRIVFTKDESELATCAQVLLFLSDGVLLGESLRLLSTVLSIDAMPGNQDRLVMSYSEEDWYFGCSEQKAAPQAIQKCLNDHEAITYRPKSNGFRRHEFPQWPGVCGKRCIARIFFIAPYARGREPRFRLAKRGAPSGPSAWGAGFLLPLSFGLPRGRPRPLGLGPKARRGEAPSSPSLSSGGIQFLVTVNAGVGTRRFFRRPVC